MDRPCRYLSPLLLMFVLALAACQPDASSNQSPPPKTQQIEIAGRSYELELALTSSQRYQGLSDRESIAEDGGMLFVFPYPQELAFVMRRCLVPIDVIFLAADGRIVAMHAMQIEPYDTSEWQLKHYRSHWPAQFAIELRSGSIEQMGLKTGDRINLPVKQLKAWAR